MTTHDAAAGTSPRTRRTFRLTSRVFWDMAIYMVGLGLVVGLIFPPFAVILGVPGAIAGRPIFHTACLVAGFMVGAMNYALCRGVVGGRMEVLGGHLRAATSSITSATHSGDWSEAVFERIDVDSNDQIGEAGRAFNSLLGAVEGRKELEERLRFQAFHDLLTGPSQPRVLHRSPGRGRRAAARAGHAVSGPVPRCGQPQDRQRQPGPRGWRHAHQAAQRAHGSTAFATPTPSPVCRATSSPSCSWGRASEHQAERVAHRIIESLRTPTRIGEHLVRTGFSIGLATSTMCDVSGIGMLRAADMAMYAAKSGGKGRLEVFQPSHHTAHLLRDAVRAELSGALDADQLELHYQPIVDVPTEQILGVRGPHPVAAPGARPRLAAGVHPAGRGDGAHRPDRPLGARRRRPGRPRNGRTGRRWAGSG